MERGRAAAADFTGGEPDGIAFGANMTTLNFLLAHAVARTLAPGDEIVVTAARPRRECLALAAGRRRPRPGGAPRADRRGRRDARPRRAGGADRRAHARGRVHARVERGRLADRPGPDRRGRARGRRAGLGGRASTSRRTGACGRATGASTCCSARPTSSSGRTSASPRSAPTWRASLPADRVRPAAETPPGHRFETGTQSHEAVAGTVAAIDYLRSLGDGSLDVAFERIQAHEDALARALPRRAPGAVELYGVRGVDGRTPTFCFNLAGQAPRAVAERLGERGLLRMGRRLLRARADARARAWRSAAAPSGPGSCTTRRSARSTGFARTSCPIGSKSLIKAVHGAAMAGPARHALVQRSRGG